MGYKGQKRFPWIGFLEHLSNKSLIKKEGDREDIHYASFTFEL